MFFLVFLCIFFFYHLPLYSQETPDAISLYKEGHKAQVLEEYYRAIELYTSSLEINPDYAPPMKGLARCFYMLSEYEQALVHVQKAQQYDKTDSELYNLEGLIQIGLGKPDRARSLFEYVLSLEPNNINAQFGLAELDIAHGKTREAARKYIESLQHSPNNQTALLELVEIYKNLGETGTAGEYLELALQYHGDDPRVHYTAGRYYYELASYHLAEYYLKTAIALKSNFYAAQQLLGIIYFLDKKYNDAKTIMEQTLSSSDPDLRHFAQYCLGLFNQEQGNTIPAVDHYLSALDIRYDDEVARIAAENIALEKIGINDQVRQNLAQYHYNEGVLLEEQDYVSQALIEYRRSLMLNYDAEEARFAYARIFKKFDYPIKYLMELKVLRDDYKTKDPDVLDEYELHLMYYYDSVTYKWRKELKAVTGDQSFISVDSDNNKTEELFDQYSIQQKKYSLMLCTNPQENDVLHPFADRVLLHYFKDMLLGYRNINPTGIQQGTPSQVDYTVSSFDQAFRKANEQSSDYFLIIRVEEKERSFEIFFTIYLSRTGSEVGAIRVYKTGNRRIQNALSKGARDLHELLPLRGTLLTRRFNRGIIDLGSYQGIKKDDTLLVVKKQKIALDHREFALAYEDSDILGTFTVTETDENVSEGIIKKKNFFDFINPGDEVIFAVNSSSSSENPSDDGEE